MLRIKEMGMWIKDKGDVECLLSTSQSLCSVPPTPQTKPTKPQGNKGREKLSLTKVIEIKPPQQGAWIVDTKKERDFPRELLKC